MICPVCKTSNTGIFIQKHQNLFGRFSLYECTDCRVQFWLPFKNPGPNWYENYAGSVGNRFREPKIWREYHKMFLNKFGNRLKGKRVLDLGCGAGEFLSELSKRGAEAWGVDFDASAIQIAKKYFRLDHLFATSFTDFFNNIATPQFDFITCFEVLEHVEDPRWLVSAMVERLKPGGIIVLSTPSRERMLANWNDWDFPPHHLTRWNVEALLRVLTPLGLKIVSIEYSEGFRFLLEAIDSHFRSGLATQKTIEQSMLARPYVVAGMLKQWMIGGIPAFFLWLWGKISGRKNGTMFVEVVKL